MPRYFKTAAAFLTAALIVGCGADAPHDDLGHQDPAEEVFPHGQAPVTWVGLSPQGALQYGRGPKGDRVPDFAPVGYHKGDKAIPNVPVVAEMRPRGEGQDDSRAIQAALDGIANHPLKGGVRGALLLRAGTYHLHAPLILNQSGIVLRGEGADKTILMGHIKPAQEDPTAALVVIGGAHNPRGGARINITDSYVPVGETVLHLSDVTPFKAGQLVQVDFATNAKWVHTLKMDQLPPRKDGRKVYQWKPSDSTVPYERTVAAVDRKAKTITLNIALPQPLDLQYGQSTVRTFEFPGRISEVGVENLRGDNQYNSKKIDAKTKEPIDESHLWTFISLRAVKNAWVRGVHAYHFAWALADIRQEAKQVTISDCHNFEPVSKVEGGRRYAFNIDGQLNLVTGCSTDKGRHDFVTGSAVAGPNVFHNGTITRPFSVAGPHMRWGTGTLFDNLTTPGTIEIIDRGNMGSGHGWAGAQNVIYNCKAKQVNCDSPQLGMSWALGGVYGGYHGTCAAQKVGTMLAPKSLYEAQRKERDRAMGIKR